ncbi:MAG: HNH endonuclease [Hylemonella sp.]
MSSSRLQHLRQRAFTRQGCRCFYCGQLMCTGDTHLFAQKLGITARQAKWLRCTAEHLRARQDGGRDTADNIVAACFWCNTRRHLGRPKRAPDANTFATRVRGRVARGKWHPAGLCALESVSPAQASDLSPCAP